MMVTAYCETHRRKFIGDGCPWCRDESAEPVRPSVRPATKPDLERYQFLQRADQIDERPPPAIETPDNDDINLFATCRA